MDGAGANVRGFKAIVGRSKADAKFGAGRSPRWCGLSLAATEMGVALHFGNPILVHETPFCRRDVFTAYGAGDHLRLPDEEHSFLHGKCSPSWCRVRAWAQLTNADRPKP